MTGLVEHLWTRGPRSPVTRVWLSRAFLGISIVLIPWIGWLFMSLPDEATAAHWRFAWGGFDVGLAGSLALTAIFLHRRSARVHTAAIVTGTMLICDAWFDVLTSRGTKDVAVAAVLAVVAELPLAALCFRIGHQVPSLDGAGTEARIEK